MLVGKEETRHFVYDQMVVESERPAGISGTENLSVQRNPAFSGPLSLSMGDFLANVNAARARHEFFQPAFHGSPHIFDQFSLHAIGSGEGRQAYGWGLYFAGEKEIAEYYRSTLARQYRGDTAYLAAAQTPSERLHD